MELTITPLAETITCPNCHGLGDVNTPDIARAKEYWARVNPESFLSLVDSHRRNGIPVTMACPCCNGTKSLTLQAPSERAQRILDRVCEGKTVYVDDAPDTLAGDDWWRLLAHPEVMLSKRGFSQDYCIFHRNSEQGRRARSFW